MSPSFFISSALLGVGLAMDAFSVSLANGLHEPCMKRRKILAIAGVFAAFQFVMPLIGWFCVSTAAAHFESFARLVPTIALILLCYIGGKMIYDSIKHAPCDDAAALTVSALILEGVATSIDALSVGFTIANYTLTSALLACTIIGVVTFAICLSGILIGRRAGVTLADKAGLLGGGILIFIGLEIFIKSLI